MLRLLIHADSLSASANVIDSSADAHTVSDNSSGIVADALRPGGKAISFDTDDHIAVSHADVFNFGRRDFTVDCWVKILGSLTYFQGIWTTRNNPAPRKGINFSIKNGYFAYAVDADSSSTTFGDPLENGVWYHTRVVGAGSRLIFFINGKNVYEIAKPTISEHTNDFDLGRAYSGYAWYFADEIYIDEIAVWDEAISVLDFKVPTGLYQTRKWPAFNKAFLGYVAPDAVSNFFSAGGGSASVTAGLQTISVSVHSVTVSVSASVSVSADVQAVSTTVRAAAISASAVVSVSAQSISYAVHSAVVTASGTVSVSADVQVIALTCYAPTITTEVSISVAASLQEITVTALACTVSTANGVAVIASLQTLIVSPQSATISCSSSITEFADVQEISILLHGVSVEAVVSVTVVSTTQSIVFSVHAANISTTTAVTIQAEVQQVFTTAHTVTVVAGGSISIPVAVQALVFSAYSADTTAGVTAAASLQTISQNIYPGDVFISASVQAAIQAINITANDVTVGTLADFLFSADLQNISLALFPLTYAGSGQVVKGLLSIASVGGKKPTVTTTARKPFILL